MELTFLYWNTEDKQAIASILEDILNNNIIHVLILGECPNPLDDSFCVKFNLTEFKLQSAEKESLKQRLYCNKTLEISLKHLNNKSEEESHEVIIEQTIFGEIIQRALTRISRTSLIEVEFNNSVFLLALVHLPSKKNYDDISQLQTAQNYKRFILENASSYDNKVVIIGDFNMNPFDSGMVEPQGFYAINYKRKVKERSVFQHSIEMMFYNPCWRFLGDYDKINDTAIVSGTHYYESPPSKRLFWHLFDQVILSKKMIANFVDNKFEIIQVEKIIEEVQTTVTRSHAIYPDHLPIKCTFNF